MRRLTVLVILVTATFIPVATAAAGGGGCHRDQSDARSNTIQLDANCFTPTVARIDVGDTVTWTNADGWVHNVYGSGFNGHADVRAGDQFAKRFDVAGVFPYVCTLHPGMMGAIVVGDGATGAAAITAATSDEQAAETEPRAAEVEPVALDEPDATVALGLLLAAIGAIVFTGVAMARRNEPVEAR